MPKIVDNRLTDRAIRALPDGEHLDGRGLSLKVVKLATNGEHLSPKFARSWILRSARRRLLYALD